ncbi:MAG: carbohydrate kinase family protein [Candidatus Bathyarchaeia archaeon]
MLILPAHFNLYFNQVCIKPYLSLYSQLYARAYSVKVADTTGAGDAFSAGFITAQLEGKNLEDSVEFANATANLKITRVGARALPNRKAVERFLKKRKESQ